MAPTHIPTYPPMALGRQVAKERVKSNFRNLKVAIKLRVMIAKKNRQVILDSSLRGHRFPLVGTNVFPSPAPNF